MLRYRRLLRIEPVNLNHYMTQESLILIDRNDLVKDRLVLMQKRMEALKSKRVWHGHDAWTWILKPDFHVGEAIIL